MEFTIERKRLLDACRKIAKVTSPATHNIKPELSGILLEADDDNKMIKLTGTNPVMSIMMKLKDVDVISGGDAVIPAPQFTSMLYAMKDEIAEVKVNETVLTLQCGNPKLSLSIMKKEDYPVIKIAYPENTVCVSGLALISKQTVAVTKNDPNNPLFSGVQVKFSPHETTAISTDGSRFVKSIGKNIADGELDMFIPEQSLKLICGIVKNNDSIYIGKTERCAVFMTSEFVYTTRLTEGNLDNVEKLMQKLTSVYKAEVDAGKLLEALDSCMVMLHNVDSCVNLTMDETTLMLSVQNKNGSMRTKVPALRAIDMNGKVFYYNPKLMFDFIKTCVGTINIEIDERGILKLISGITVYIVCPRTAARVKAKKSDETTDTAKNKEKSKTKKGKTAKDAAA